MDAELAAVKRLVAGTQDATVCIGLENMASLRLIRVAFKGKSNCQFRIANEKEKN
ncbi:MAG: hypothetical protein ACLR2G_09930 [Phascolarctobacterium faecium]